MSTSALRQTLRLSVSLRRCNSSKPPTPSTSQSPSHPPLPLQKMRALVSLYHQAENFITPETLDEAIDKAFIETSTVSTARNLEKSHFDLKGELMRRQLLPKIGSGRGVSASGALDVYSYQWSDTKAQREMQVQNALYGIEGRGKPGLEVLEEEHERIQAHLKNDRKS